jgi:DnaK suppressor protein
MERTSEINPRQLDSFRKQLVNEIARLSLNQAAAVMQLTGDAEAASDIIDKAAREERINYAFKMRERERLLSRKIKRALVRIEEGTFGICQGCGEDIPIARLKARPVTDYCFDCKVRMEARERAVESARIGVLEAG